MILAIDTNILVNAFKEGESEHLDVVSLVNLFEFKVGFDFNGVVEGEYQNNLAQSKSYQKWRKRLLERKATHQCAANLPQRHKAQLSTFGCHEPTDHVFIGVAFSTDKILISEDSDVGKGPKGGLAPHCEALHYLTHSMAMKVFEAREAVEHIRRQK